ncbi:MAG TPA: peptidoglycan-binding domain-containing protein, partial [Solirubrobacteraceae bacterium]|nr:peptidoglycan-binding domain-containing protein [Solirubrobacteraceae bacterium]
MASLPLAAGASARVPGVALPGPRVTSAARGRAGALSAATVREAQQLFRELGYPLGRERPGVLGVDTRGALSYFQRKYRLPVTGRPDASTLARMRAVAASLRGTPVARESSPHDLVEDVLGDGVPILGVAAALAALLGLL